MNEIKKGLIDSISKLLKRKMPLCTLEQELVKKIMKSMGMGMKVILIGEQEGRAMVKFIVLKVRERSL